MIYTRTEYMTDHVGFFHAQYNIETGLKARPLEIVQGDVVFDSKREHAKRAENRRKVEEWNRRTPRPNNPRRTR